MGNAQTPGGAEHDLYRRPANGVEPEHSGTQGSGPQRSARQDSVQIVEVGSGPDAGAANGASVHVGAGADAAFARGRGRSGIQGLGQTEPEGVVRAPVPAWQRSPASPTRVGAFALATKERGAEQTPEGGTIHHNLSKASYPAPATESLSEVEQRQGAGWRETTYLPGQNLETLKAEEETEDWAPQHWSRQEWFYMWTKGLDPGHIAKVCRVPYRKVYDHIRTRVNYNPALFGQRLMLHDHPQEPRGGLGNWRPTWQERAAELIEFRWTHGRFPRGYIDGESSLYSFLQYQRQLFRAGRLSSFRKALLDDEAPGWLTPPKIERENTLWEQRMTELENFLCENKRYPSYKKAVNSAEKILAVWLHRQRQCLRTGKLGYSREQRLNAVLQDRPA